MRMGLNVELARTALLIFVCPGEADHSTFEASVAAPPRSRIASGVGSAVDLGRARHVADRLVRLETIHAEAAKGVHRVVRADSAWPTMAL